MIDYRKDFIAMAAIVINNDLDLFTAVTESEVDDYLKDWEALNTTTDGFTRELEEYIMYCIREETNIGFKRYLEM
jgi:hypothetical protein